MRRRSRPHCAIKDATSDTYTPDAGDVDSNVTLSAVATYTDGQGHRVQMTP